MVAIVVTSVPVREVLVEGALDEQQGVGRRGSPWSVMLGASTGRSVTTSAPSAGRVVVRCSSQCASSRSGKSERTCPPRVSSRRCATSEQDLPEVQQVGRLPRGRAGLGRASAAAAARSASASSAPAVDGRSAPGPTPRVIARCTSRRCEASSTAASPASARRRPQRQLAVGEPAGDVVGDAVGEDQALEQRVRGEPVGAVHPGARALPAGVEPVDARSARRRSVSTPPRGVVLGRRDRQQLGGRVEPELAAAGDDRREALLEEVARRGAGRRATRGRPAGRASRRRSPGPRRRAARGRRARDGPP